MQTIVWMGILLGIALAGCGGHRPSPADPGGTKEVPMFVTLGFDDNGVAGNGTPPQGMTWALDMLAAVRNADGSAATASFYLTSAYATGEETGYGLDRGGDPAVVAAWKRALAEGHELGNHTHSHPHGSGFTQAQWQQEMQQCTDVVARLVGKEAVPMAGFRTPFLEYNDAALDAAAALGFAYDCSIEEGFEPHQDGTNFPWPYQRATAHGSLWELPVYAVIVPPDDLCPDYGVAPGLRAKLQQRQDYFDPADGKITGFDYNLWVLFRMTKDEFLATLRYSFDLHRRGNRAPFLFGMHSDIYAQGYPEEGAMAATWQERQWAVERFLAYVTTFPDVQVRSAVQVLDWIRTHRAGTQ